MMIQLSTDAQYIYFAIVSFWVHVVITGSNKPMLFSHGPNKVLLLAIPHRAKVRNRSSTSADVIEDIIDKYLNDDDFCFLQSIRQLFYILYDTAG